MNKNNKKIDKDFELLKKGLNRIVIKNKFKQRWSNIMKKILSFLKEKHFIKQHLLFVSYLTIGILIILLILSNFRIVGSPISKKIDTLYYTWVDFQRLSGKEIHRMWNEKFHEATYKSNGDAKYNEYDCTGAIYWFLKDLKSNFPLVNVEQLYSILQNSSIKRRNFSEIKPKDLIIIYVKNNWHVGMIEKKLGTNKIKYLDINILSDGPGYREIEVSSYMIKGIYPITLELWMGDALKNINEVSSNNK